MDQNKLSALLAAIDLGNLTRAADRLGYTQSGLSYIIKTLETELGFPLLIRSRTGVRPTADCLRVLPLLRDLDHTAQRLEQEAAEIRGLAVGTVSLAVFPCISRFWLPDILRNFSRAYPDITISIRECGQEEIDASLLDGTIDFAFCSRQPNDPNEWVQFMTDDICAVVPEDHPLAAREDLPLALLAREPFFIEDSAYDHDIPRVLAEADFHPNIHWSSQDELAILAMVRAGLGVCVLPGLYLREGYPGVRVLPLRPRAYRQLGALMPSIQDLSPAARRFLSSARDTMAVG